MKSERDNLREHSFRVPPLILLILGGLTIALIFRELSNDLHAKGFVSIDTLRSEVEPLNSGSHIASWIDPRWEHELSLDLADYADVSAFDQAGLEALARVIEERSFVAAVGEAKVVWPDGLSVEVRFEKPIACLGVEGEFLTSSAEGIVLPGPWSSPPEIDAAPLPILSANSFSRDELRPGLQIQTPELFDALAVANSMQLHLPVDVQRELGPLVIDARLAREASLEIPGVVLDLEFGRRILFGRAPDGSAPGELPPRMKWKSVARGKDALKAGLDWILLDVRWDEPCYVTREGEEGTL